ncbi:MAG: hypothetical protein EBT08_19620, partial [Betaproteobacteria bacterium]|nr:hypothetical protein [Betaproteobacteria bacterium]
DVAYRYFNTAQRKFIVADCPGHEQYTRNMVTGASNADVAVLLVDARRGFCRKPIVMRRCAAGWVLNASFLPSTRSILSTGPKHGLKRLRGSLNPGASHSDYRMSSRCRCRRWRAMAWCSGASASTGMRGLRFSRSSSVRSRANGMG